MAKQKHSRRPWWQLDVLMLMIIGLLFLAHRLAPSPDWRTFLEVGVVIVGYSLIAWWLKTHPDVLQRRPAAEAGSSLCSKNGHHRAKTALSLPEVEENY